MEEFRGQVNRSDPELAHRVRRSERPEPTCVARIIVLPSDRDTAAYATRARSRQRTAMMSGGASRSKTTARRTTLLCALVLLALAATVCRASDPKGGTPNGDSKTTESPQSVSYRVCARAETWATPTSSEVEGLFTNPRFGDGLRPSPLSYSLYVQDFYWIRSPTAVSANVELVAFSGQTLKANSGNFVRLCDYASLAASAQRGDSFESIWLKGWDVESIERGGDLLSVHVKAAMGVFEDVVFPFPPTSTLADVRAVEAIDSAGSRVFRQDQKSTWEVTSKGLRFAWFSGAAEITIPATGGGATGDAMQATLFSGTGANSGGTARVLDANGMERSRVSWTNRNDPWEAVASLELPASGYTVVVESGGSGGFLLLPSSKPQPMK